MGEFREGVFRVQVHSGRSFKGMNTEDWRMNNEEWREFSEKELRGNDLWGLQVVSLLALLVFLNVVWDEAEYVRFSAEWFLWIYFIWGFTDRLWGKISLFLYCLRRLRSDDLRLSRSSTFSAALRCFSLPLSVAQRQSPAGAMRLRLIEDEASLRPATATPWHPCGGCIADPICKA